MIRLKAGLILYLALAAFQAAAAAEPGVRVIAPEDLQYRSEPAAPGVGIAVVEGDPRQGPYTLRVQFPPGSHAAPHRHPDRRTVTVLSGVYYFATGTIVDEQALKPHGAGTVLILPANTAHYSATREQPAVVQEAGPGPTALIPVQP